MRTECDELLDQIEWLDRKEFECLTLTASGRFAEQKAICAIGYRAEVEPWEIGRAAWLAWGERKGSGFSPGVTKNEEKCRLNWASGASKARGKWNLKTLQNELDQFRKDGGKPQSVSWQQMIARCDHLILHGSAGESLRAIELKTKLTGKGDSDSRQFGQVYRHFVTHVGSDAAREGFILLGMKGWLIAMELENEQRNRNGDSEGGTANDSSGPEGGRVYGSRGDAEDALDQQRGTAGGADTSQRPVGGRDIEGRVTELEKLELKKLQEARP